MRNANEFAQTTNAPRLFLAGILAAWLALSLPVQAEPLRLNSGVGSPYFKPDRTGFIDLIVPEIFRRIGVEAEGLQYAASERAMINANNGVDDGVVLRIRGLEKIYPNLVLVNEKIIDNEFVAYAKQVKFATTSFATLKDRQVGYINGWKIFESNLPAGTAVTKVQDASQLFSLIEKERIDVALYERWQGNQIIQTADGKIGMLTPPLATSEMFIYLHRKHAHLAEAAARALRDMKADGTWRRIATQSLPGFASQ